MFTSGKGTLFRAGNGVVNTKGAETRPQDIDMEIDKVQEEGKNLSSAFS